MTFEQALELVLRAEGGYVDDPADPGGATNYGVTQETYNTFRRRLDLQPRPVRMIEKPEVVRIYTGYWQEARCDLLRWPVSAVHFDCAVNTGFEQAAKTLQRALNGLGASVNVDGIVGPKTAQAAAGFDHRAVADAYLWERMRFYAKLARAKDVLRKFLPQWALRLIHLRGEVL